MADHPRIAIQPVYANGAESLAALAARLFEQAFEAENTPDNMRMYLASAFSPAAQRTELTDPDRAT